MVVTWTAVNAGWWFVCSVCSLFRSRLRCSGEADSETKSFSLPLVVISVAHAFFWLHDVLSQGGETCVGEDWRIPHRVFKHVSPRNLFTPCLHSCFLLPMPSNSTQSLQTEEKLITGFEERQTSIIAFFLVLLRGVKVLLCLNLQRD